MLQTKTMLLLLGILVLTCYRAPSRRGPEYELYVFAEHEDYVALEKTLHSVFEQKILTPQPETHFKLVQVPVEKFNEFLTHKQLLFLASLQSKGEIADLVKRSIDQPGIRENVEQGKNFFLKREDQWIRGQLIVTLVAPTLEELRQRLEKNSDFLYNYFYRFQQQTVSRFIYRTLENKDLARQLLDKYQWQVRVPHDFFIARENSEDHFVFLRRRIPERWVFVKWLDHVGSELITPEWYYDLRDSIGVRYYGGDRINRNYTSAKEIEFLNRWCLKIEGLWENEEQVAGGPFFAYVFYDEDTDRIYVIDCATFAPNREKIPFLDQMDAIARTFKTKVEVQREELE